MFMATLNAFKPENCRIRYKTNSIVNWKERKKRLKIRLKNRIQAKFEQPQKVQHIKARE